MPGRLYTLTHQSQFRHFLGLSLLLLMVSLSVVAYARPVRGNPSVSRPAWQEETVWCFSPIVDRQRDVAYYLIHPEGLMAETILEDHAMPVVWKANLSDPICFADWHEAASYRQDIDPYWEGYEAETRASFNEAMQKLYGKSVMWFTDRPRLLLSDRALEVETIWCYTFFQPDEDHNGVFLGHFAGLEPESVLSAYAETLDMTRQWRAWGSECFPTWRLAYSFTKYLTQTIEHSYTGEKNWARTVMTADGTPWPAHSLLAPSHASALLNPNASPVWCHTIFGGTQGTITFAHYPDLTVEEVMEFYNPPNWVRGLAASETTNCYTSWEAAFRARPFEWKKYNLQFLPDHPSEADYEAVSLAGAFSDDQWQDYQRPEFSASGTPNPLVLTRIAPTPTITPTPTPTPTIDASSINRDSAVWCFTHVEDLSHEVVFYMGHPPDTDYNGIQQAYKLPPGLLSQPDRDTYCYENWHEAAIFVRSFSAGNIIPYTLPEHSSAEQLRDYQNLIEQSFGTLFGDDVISDSARSPGYRDRPDQPVWCYSYFSKSDPDSGIYLGHYVTEGDEAILADYGQNASEGWKRAEATTHCFESWNKAFYFHRSSLGQYIKISKFNIRPFDHALALITERAPIPFSGQPILVPTSTATVTPTPTATPTATRSPSGAGLLNTETTQAVWCYTIFTGGNGSTISFGHYPGMSTDEVFTMFHAPDWVKNLAGKEESNCYPSWEAAFEGLSPPGLKVGLSAYLPDNPSEADYEMVILWSYFKIEWQDYQRSEFSADGTPQPIILTRMAPAPDTTPTPMPVSDTPIWCFTLYYDHTPGVFDVMVGHYPEMDDAAIAAMHGLRESFRNERPERKQACFYSYTDAAKFQRAIFEGHPLDRMRLSEDEAVNQAGIEARYIKKAYEMVYTDDLERAEQIFDDGLFTQPRNQNASLPASDPEALLLDTEHPPVWCYTYFWQDDELIFFGHYPDMDVEDIGNLYFVHEFLADATVDKRLCYSSWEAAAKIYKYPATSQLNEADFEILVLQSSFTSLWSMYRRPQFSPSVTPQIFQVATPVATPVPDTAASASLLDAKNLPRWCQTRFMHKYAKMMTVGHYPDMDIENFLKAIEAENATTECYTSWRSAATALPRKDFKQLNLPQSSDGQTTDKDFEFALLHYHFDQWLVLFWREEFSAEAPAESVTPVSFDDVVWCNYFLAKENPAGGRGELLILDNYPDRRVDELLEAAGLSQNWQDPYHLITIFCYDSWQKALTYAFADDVDAFRPSLPDPLNDGDYEILFLWFSYRDEWETYQRPEFSADEAPQPAVIDFVEELVERFD